MGAAPERAKMSQPILPVKVSSGKSEGTSKPKLQTVQLNFFYGNFQALHDINLAIPEKRVGLWQIHVSSNLESYQRDRQERSP